MADWEFHGNAIFTNGQYGAHFDFSDGQVASRVYQGVYNTKNQSSLRIAETIIDSNGASTGKYEYFSLPVPTVNDSPTAHQYYNIITEKNISDIPDASTTTTGLINTTTQTIAGDKYFNAFINIQNTHSNGTGINFYFSDAPSGKFGTIWLSQARKFCFREYRTNSDGEPQAGYERYDLPAADIGTTATNVYNILTTKNISDIPDASTTVTGLINTTTQAFTGTKTFDAIITPDVTIPSGFIYFKETGKNSIAARISILNRNTVSTDHRTQFLQYNYNTDGTKTTYYDAYYLPNITVATNANKTYDIYTSKNKYDPFNNLSYATNTPVDGDVYISSYADGSGSTSTNVTYYRRDISALYKYMHNVISVTPSYTTNTLITEANFTGNYRLYKIGNIRILRMAGVLTSATASADVTIGTIPADSYPLNNVYIQGTQDTSSFNNVVVQVSTAGNIIMKKYGSATNSFRGNIVWVTA